MSKNIKNSSSKSKKDFLKELRTLQKNGGTDEGHSTSAAEHYDAAYDAAYTFILKGYEDKMRRAAERGSTRAYLYRWNYEADPKSRKYKFKGVRIFDIVTKGNLIERLTAHFQKINSEFIVGWHKFKDEDKSRPTRYGIYVSWAEVTSDDAETNNSTDKTLADTEEEEEVEISV